ncbi:MAG TPA: carboxypeptidase-like regulatory domain-containing protein [Mycobacteriales bacterium]|nr:carboxypeptidase-like regulatory domain-containing protein [Mycobacteriales bacterium]
MTAGNSPTLSGVVRDSRGDAIEGATVTIFSKGYGETRYTAAATMETDAAGQYRITVRPLKQTAYGVNVGNAKSPTLNVRVSTRVNIARPTPSTVSNPVTFSGTLAPGYARVAVGLGYLTNGRFIVLKQADTNGTGGYTITSVLPRGTFAFVVFTSAHQGTDKGSKSVRLTVR